MNTFEITIQRKAGAAWPVVAEQSRPGNFLPVRSEGLLTLEPEQLLAEVDPLRYGQHLGEALFKDGLRDGLARALADSQNNLRVLLFVEADDLRLLRWERLCAPLHNRWLPLARNAQALYSLYLPSVTDSRFPAIGRRDLRALVVAANPTGLERYNLSPFDLPGAIASLCTALGDLPFDLLASGPGAADHPTHQPVGPASLDQICEQLTREKYTLLHIIGHGLYNKRSSDSALFLANAQGQVSRVAGGELLDRLRQLRGARGLPHLIYLAGCPSAPAEAEGAFSHLGQALVRELGMPAVIATLETAPASVTASLLQTFYQQLRQHGEIDRSLVAASAGWSDLAPPALYSRLGSRPLFSDQLAQDRPLTNAEIEEGLTELRRLLPARAAVLTPAFEAAADRLRPTLTAEVAALSPALRAEREAALADVDAIASEVLDFSFAALALGQEPPAYDERCPYLGLAAFHAENRAFFFGREPLVNKLVNRLAEHNFLAVLGGSGSGKSSLVLAGVVPALEAQNPNLAVRYLTPTSNPLARLDTVLADATPEQPQVLVVDQFEELFTLCPDPAQRQHFLDRLLGLLAIRNSPFAIHHLPFTIILTMRADFWGECAAYAQLRDLMQAHQELVGPMTAQELRSSMEQQARVVGLRFETDLSNTILDDVAGEPGAMPLLQHALLELWQRRHGRWLRAAEYRNLGGVQQAIAGTADSIYTQLGDADRERMRAIFLRLTRLDEGGEGEAQRDTRRRVRLDELVSAADEAAVRALVQRLADARLVVTTVRESASPPPPTQRGGTVSALPPSQSFARSTQSQVAQAPILALTNQQPPPLSGEGRGGVEVEVTHEALIRHWPRLRTWLDEDRVALRLRQNLSNAAAHWDAGERADSLLPRWNARLEETQRLAQNPRFGLNSLERAYLDACIALREREAAEKEAQRQRELHQAQALAAEQRQRAEEQAKAAANLRRRAVFLATAGALAVLLAIAAGWFGVRAQRSEKVADQRRQDAETAKADADIQRDKAKKNEAEAQKQAALARSRELGVHADTARAAGNLDLALLLRIEGARTQATPDMMNDLRALLTEDQRTIKRIPGHNSPVTQAQWNQDQSRLLIAYADGSAGIWDSATYTQVVKLAGHTARINVAAWRPDDQQLLTAGEDGLVRVWDATNGAQLLELPAGSEQVNLAEWNADGSRILTAGDDGTVRLWATDQAEQEPTVLTTGDSTVRLAHWNADGDHILTVSDDNSVRVWPVATDDEPVELSGHESLIYSAAWNADESRILTASADKTARIWDAASGEELLALTGHADSVTTAAWSPDGLQVLTASLDGTARIWDAETGGELFKLAGHGAAVSQAFWSQDSNLALIISDKAVQVWDALTGELFFDLVGHTAKVTTAQWSADASQILTASEDGTVRIWDASTSPQPAGELPVLARHSGRIGSMIWNTAGDRLLTTGLDDATARVVDTQNGVVVVTFAGHSAGINAVQWNRDETRVLTGSDDGTARIWDVATGAELWQVQHAQAVYSVAWSPDGQTVLTASDDGSAMIWDATTRKALRMLRRHGKGVLLARWNHDGSRILTASRDDTARVWAAATGQQLLKLDAHTDEVTQALWNQDESRIFTASDDATIKLWDAQSGALLQTFSGHSGVIHSLQINRAESELLSTSADGTARFWDIATGRERWQAQQAEAIFSATWSPDEGRILTTSADGTAQLWDAQSGAALATLLTDGHPIRQGLWNGEGSRVLTAGDDGQVRQFYTQDADVIAAACARGAIRNMTPEEWQQFMVGESYRVTCDNLPAE